MNEPTVVLARNDIDFDEDLPATVWGIPVPRPRGSHCEIEVPADVAIKRPRWATALLLGVLCGVVVGLAVSAPQTQWTKNHAAPVTSMWK